MKKEKSSTIVNVFNRIINIRAWFDIERVKAGTVYLLDGMKKLFIPQSRTSGESFEAAIAKLQLTEADLEIKKTALRRLSLLMVIVAGLIFIYACYNFIVGHFVAGGLSIIVMLIALVLGFRYHFWYFQIRQRKLGCTFYEWYTYGLRGKRS